MSSGRAWVNWGDKSPDFPDLLYFMVFPHGPEGSKVIASIDHPYAWDLYADLRANLVGKLGQAAEGHQACQEEAEQGRDIAETGEHIVQSVDLSESEECCNFDWRKDVREGGLLEDE